MDTKCVLALIFANAFKITSFTKLKHTQYNPTVWYSYVVLYNKAIYGKEYVCHAIYVMLLRS